MLLKRVMVLYSFELAQATSKQRFLMKLRNKILNWVVPLFAVFNIYQYAQYGEYWFGLIALICTTVAMLGLWFLEEILDKLEKLK
jgi:hypothetical protein